MKKLLNTLYVSTQGVYLRQEGETVVAEKEKQVVLRLPVHTISGIVCFGNVMCSPFLLGLCGERGICVTFLSEHGKFLARVEGPVSGNVLLRMEQMKLASFPEKAIIPAKCFVLGKIMNCRTLLQRRIRDHGDSEACSKAVSLLASSVRNLESAADGDSIRGYEGHAADLYFNAFNDLILSQKNVFFMKNRNRRPPRDPINSLLSFLYTLLAHECVSALESVGLDPQIGFLHGIRPGRPGLALDLMEEFRPFFADRLALSLINLNQIQGKGFKLTESGPVLMDDDTRKIVLTAWQNRKQEEILHPFLAEKIKIGLLPYIQAMLLARFIRGELDLYPPFLIK